MRARWLCGLIFIFLVRAAVAAEIDVLSAGAVEPGLAAAATLFGQETGTTVKLRYATAPMLRQRIGGGEAADLLIAPPAVIADLVRQGRLDDTPPFTLGRVGVGVAVRDGAPVPDVSSLDALRQALIAADSLVYNRASTGIYLQALFERLGLAERLQAKTTRTDSGEAVFEHVMHGRGNEIGFGAVTEIMRHHGKGLRFVAALPAEVQNYTAYAAVPLPAAKARPEVQAFMSFLSTRATPIMRANGIE